METKSLLLPAKCSSTCALILDSSTANLQPLFNRDLPGQMTTNIYREDVNQRENKHPDQVNKVPVETADFNVFVIYFLHPNRHHAKVENAGGDVEHVQAGNGKESGAKQRRRQSSVRSCEGRNPMGRQTKRPQAFAD